MRPTTHDHRPVFQALQSRYERIDEVTLTCHCPECGAHAFDASDDGNTFTCSSCDTLWDYATLTAMQDDQMFTGLDFDVEH